VNEPQLVFSDAEHKYTLGGRELPSVTQTMAKAGIVDTRWYNDEACKRGKYVHKAVHLHTQGILDYNTLDSTIEPYFAAYLKFERQMQVTVLASEQMVYSRNYGYAGAYDLILEIDAVRYMVDIKSGSIQRWTGIQLAAYQDAETEFRPGSRAGLCLKKDGSYSFVPYSDPNDIHVFRSALTINTFKHRSM